MLTVNNNNKLTLFMKNYVPSVDSILSVGAINWKVLTHSFPSRSLPAPIYIFGISVRNLSVC